MKIIKKGTISTNTKKFTCDKCGCVFEAEENEYCASSQMEVMPNYKCKCPTCKNMVYTD